MIDLETDMVELPFFTDVTGADVIPEDGEDPPSAHKPAEPDQKAIKKRSKWLKHLDLWSKQAEDIRKQGDKEETKFIPDRKIDLGQLYINFDGLTSAMSKKRKKKKDENNIDDSLHAKSQRKSINFQDRCQNRDELDDVMKKSVITADFDTQHSVPPYKVSLRQGKKARKLERDKTKGAGWFNLPATEMTESLSNDVELLKMRNALDPKRFYKHNDTTVAPKYFQVGTIVENSADFYSSRIPRKQRKATLVDELLADFEAKSYFKRKYKEVKAAEARTKSWQPYSQIKRKRKAKSHHT